MSNYYLKNAHQPYLYILILYYVCKKKTRFLSLYKVDRKKCDFSLHQRKIKKREENNQKCLIAILSGFLKYF